MKMRRWKKYKKNRETGKKTTSELLANVNQMS